jgi:hypothetical protein
MRNFLIFVSLMMLLACPALAEVSENSADHPGTILTDPYDGPIWDMNRAILFDGGTYLTHAGTGVGGADESWLDVTAGMGTFGFGCQFATGIILADDFVVPADEIWDITGFTCFAYQSFAGPPSTITGVYFAIFDDSPEFGNIVAGDHVTNAMTSTAWTNCYRVRDTDSGVNADRPIMANEAALAAPVVLGPGTYWVAWMVDGSATSGPWGPPVTIIGQPNTGNAMQFYNGVWSAVIDVDTQGMPFMIHGTNGTTATMSTNWSNVKAIY